MHLKQRIETCLVFSTRAKPVKKPKHLKQR